ncbi:MAG: GNAT family N-acetyltransferase [Actinobacteria bacterium]|nr:GNAT family N-acetyltransferase [Actinomycetota bacterium]
MARPVEIRRAGAAEAPIVARLLHDFNAEFGEQTPTVEVLTELTRPLLEGGEILVFLAGEADGISLWRLRPSPWTGRPEAYLQELYVVPERRGEGRGRALLEATMAAAREAGATGIDLNTGETDAAARALYESAGFTNLEGPGGPRMLFYEREL